MIEIHLCPRGDVFVSENGAARWSPYGSDAAGFQANLSLQPHVTLRYRDLGEARETMRATFAKWLEQALFAAPAYGTWRGEGDKLAADWPP